MRAAKRGRVRVRVETTRSGAILAAACAFACIVLVEAGRPGALGREGAPGGSELANSAWGDIAAAGVVEGDGAKVEGAGAKNAFERQGAPQVEGGPSVRFVFPTEKEYVSGMVTLRAALSPADTRFERASFFADGKPVCTLSALPLECRWDAGPGVTAHEIVVSVVLPGGGRLSANVRTRELGYVESVEVSLVQITAIVTGPDGRFVTGLPKDAFRVYEDDRPVQITYFASENIPLEVVTAVDISGSMTGSLPGVKIAVKNFLGALRPSDVVTLLGFNENVFTAARPTVDLAARLRSVDRLSAWGGTSLYEVIVRSLEGLGSKEGRRALVIFTDGEDTTSTVGIEAAEGRAETSDATMYMIGQGKATATPRFKEVLERLARRSGGRAFFTEVPAELDRVFQQILEELSHQYLMAYEPRHPSSDTAWHRLRVELRDSGHEVRARQGYRLRRADARAPHNTEAPEHP